MKKVLIHLALASFISFNSFSQIEIDSFGNAGIGTASPTTKLDVNGKFRVRDISLDNTKDSVLVVSGDGTVAYRDASSIAGGVTAYSVGDFAHGGIVFWVDESGQHGLVCAKLDQSSGIRWYAGANTNTMALGDGALSGKANTTIVIANQGYGDGSTYAARICNELQLTEGVYTYGDWYLPSKYELSLIYSNKAVIDSTSAANGGSAFGIGYYWSSTEFSSGNSWEQLFFNGAQFLSLKSNSDNVRAVRAF